MFVTPRMHGIHHSTKGEEMNTNYSSLLSWWDRVHGSLRLGRAASA
jgi:sterol desaturase/sphingolipid hydroxylase (fatty acid hydroxylase superfamily)